MKISKEIIKIIDSGTTNANIYYLPDVQLDRATYQAVNKVLVALGGKWNRKLKGHLFESDIDTRIDAVLSTGSVIDKKKELQFFETPKAIVNKLCSMANLSKDSVVLEPSAGAGAIIRGIKQYTDNIYWAELDNDNALKIDIGEKIGIDFLSIPVGGIKFNRIVMNPPFSKQQDIEHVTHALKFLDSGILISIMSPSIKFRSNKKTKQFLELISQYDYEIIDLPAGSFKESGTMINTIILKITK